LSSAPDAPLVVVIAGPNGSGKTTIAPSLLRDFFGVRDFVNADTIASGISGFDPDRVALAAGRMMLGRLHELAAQRQSFAFETTLASRHFAPWIAGSPTMTPVARGGAGLRPQELDPERMEQVLASLPT
jgi:predicted ABC-type ATPase